MGAELELIAWVLAWANDWGTVPMLALVSVLLWRLERRVLVIETGLKHKGVFDVEKA